MHERSLVSLKVEPRSASRLCSALFILPLFYLPDYNLRPLAYGAKNASVEINLRGKLCSTLKTLFQFIVERVNASPLIKDIRCREGISFSRSHQ